MSVRDGHGSPLDGGLIDATGMTVLDFAPLDDRCPLQQGIGL
jgi:hypothetical protein